MNSAKTFISLCFVTIFALGLFIVPVSAQQIRLEGGPLEQVDPLSAITSGRGADVRVSPEGLSKAQVYTLIAIRFILVAILVFSAVMSAFKAYRWATAETNAIKIYESKEAFAKWILIVTCCFALLSIYNNYVDLTKLVI